MEYQIIVNNGRAEIKKSAGKTKQGRTIWRFVQTVNLTYLQLIELVQNKSTLLMDLEIDKSITNKTNTLNEKMEYVYNKILLFGKNRTRSREYLKNILGVSDRQMRQFLADMRKAGYMINGSDKGGYYKPIELSELKEHYRIERKRALSVLVHLRPYRKAIENYSQYTLDLKGDLNE